MCTIRKQVICRGLIFSKECVFLVLSFKYQARISNSRRIEWLIRLQSLSGEKTISCLGCHSRLHLWAPSCGLPSGTWNIFSYGSGDRNGAFGFSLHLVVGGCWGNEEVICLYWLFHYLMYKHRKDRGERPKIILTKRTFLSEDPDRKERPMIILTKRVLLS